MRSLTHENLKNSINGNKSPKDEKDEKTRINSKTKNL